MPKLALVHFDQCMYIHSCVSGLYFKHPLSVMQCLQALEKISFEQPLACLQSGAIMSVLTHIEFLTTSVQVMYYHSVFLVQKLRDCSLLEFLLNLCVDITRVRRL